jgi:hypothetical protein
MTVELISPKQEFGKKFQAVKKTLSERKLRLCGVGCCRLIRHLLPYSRSIQALDVAERFADGQASSEELKTARVWAAEVSLSISRAEVHAAATVCAAPGFGPPVEPQGRSEITQNVWGVWDVALHVVWALVRSRVKDVSRQFTERVEAESTAWKEMLDLLWDMAGDLFSPVVLDPLWRNATVRALAEGAYLHRTDPHGFLDPDRLAVLADALEDAGCTDQAILSHCRTRAVHVRGCWAVDVLLEKK